jgi:hypothetical protein
VTKKPDPRDAPFKRTVTPAEIKSTNDLGTLKKGLEEARDKIGYWRGKQLEPDASPEEIAWGYDRAVSATATYAGAFPRLESIEASIRRKGKLGYFAQKADEFLNAHPAGSTDQFWHWLCGIPGASKRIDKTSARASVHIAGHSLSRKSLKDYLGDARKRLSLRTSIADSVPKK